MGTKNEKKSVLALKELNSRFSLPLYWYQSTRNVSIRVLNFILFLHGCQFLQNSLFFKDLNTHFPYLSTFGITVTLAATLVIRPEHTALWVISPLVLAATGGLGDTSEPHTAHRCHIGGLIRRTPRSLFRRLSSL